MGALKYKKNASLEYTDIQQWRDSQEEKIDCTYSVSDAKTLLFSRPNVLLSSSPVLLSRSRFIGKKFPEPRWLLRSTTLCVSGWIAASSLNRQEDRLSLTGLLLFTPSQLACPEKGIIGCFAGFFFTLLLFLEYACPANTCLHMLATPNNLHFQSLE